MDNFTLWRWKAIDTQGQLQQGALLADDRLSAVEKLIQRELQVLRLGKASGQRRGCWHIQQKINVFRQLATLLQAGIPLSDGLALIARQHPFREWAALLEHIEQQVSQGISFSDALQQWPRIFPSLFIALVHTGEQTGKLDDCCRHLADRQEQLYQLHKKVVKALRYPGFIMVAALLVTAGMVGFVLPEFATIYRSFNAPLPGITLAVMALSEWVTSQGVIWGCGLLMLLASWLFLRQRRPGWQESEQRLLLALPLIAPLWRGQILSQLYTILSLSQQAGIPLLQALENAEKTLPYLLWKKIITQVCMQVSVGTPLWKAIKEAALFTPLCSQLIQIGEESGALDLMLERLANWHYGQTQELADNLASTLEPVMMIVTGVIIGTLVVAMYLPIFQLGDAMSGG